jgi:phosphatidylglycerol:prolipoprotein diacylglycerol transferase
MHGLVINIDPVILQLGAFELRWYSVAIMLAAIAATVISVRECKKQGIDTEQVYGLLPWILVGGLIGARLFHVVDYWGYYADNPFQILQFNQGGLAIWGGLAGGGAATIIYAWSRNIPIGRLADAVVPALLTGQIIGRFGCIINGDAYGGITSLPWGFIYVHPNALIPGSLVGLPTHPYPVYEMIWNGLIPVSVMRLRRHFEHDGLTFLTYLSLHSLGRFILSFVRQENVIFWGLQQAQIVAIGVLILSLAALIYLFKRKEVRRATGSAV